MRSDIKTYEVKFTGFSIEFDIHKESSLKMTKEFSSHGSGFVYADFDTLVSVNEMRYPIMSGEDQGNLICILPEVIRQLINLNTLPDVSNIIPKGGLADWMYTYWEKLNNSENLTNDDVLYDLLYKFCVFVGDRKYISAYIHNQALIMEVAIEDAGIKSLKVFSEFNLDDTVDKLLNLRKSITSDILNCFAQSMGSV